MAKQPTIPVNVVDKSIPEYDDSLIAIINEPNPVTGYEINEQQLRQLIQMPQYWITDENGRTINGVNFYEYFPRGGGGGGRLPIVVEKTITENGVYMAVDDHADGYNKVIVNTPVPPPAPVLIEKTVTENGTYLPADDDADGYSKVNVEIPIEEKTVKFYDYDGEELHSYTKNEFLALTEIPSNPTHTGLTSQGWNYNLTDAKTYVNKYGSLNIGQMYITDDGKTRIYITLTEGRISPILQLYLNANSELDIDWGDDTTHSTFTTTTTDYVSERHNYATAGDYVIAISVTSGSFALNSSSSSYYASSILWNASYRTNSPNKAYNNAIKKIEIGTGIISIGTYAFYGCSSLTSITIPDTVTSINNYAFQNCSSLTSITIPNSIIDIYDNTFQSCYSLTSIIIPNSVIRIRRYAFYYCYSLTSITIPDSVTSIGGNAFDYCYSLASVTIPDSVTNIDNGVFNSCYSLTSIIIPNGVTSIGGFSNCYSLTSITIPDSVTSIGGFGSCYSLQSITIPDGVTSIGQSAFKSCYALQSITIPDTVTTIGQYAFQDCGSLLSITIPDGVTSIGNSVFYSCDSLTSITIPDTVTNINQYAFYECCSLSEVTIGSGVTSINGYAFYNCSYMESITFKPTTPPTVSNSNAWQNVPTTCKIYVPNNALNAYKSATNYPNPNTYTYIGY